MKYTAISLPFSLAILLFWQTTPSLGEGMRNRIKIKTSSELIVEENSETTEEYTLEKMLLLAKKRKGLIQDIKRFLREARGEDQKTELNLRLGSLYMEDYHALLASAQAKGDSKQTAASAKAASAEARVSLERALIIYQVMQDRYPQHPRADEMLYSLATANEDRGHTNKAMHFFQRLASMNSSKFADDARIHLGDYYFDHNQFPKATEYFEQIIQGKRPRLLPYAVYKKAWCLYNEQKYLAAVNHFKWVAKLDKSNSTIRVRNEAVRDIALPFVELKAVDEAMRFYQSQGEADFRLGLETMAAQFLLKGDYRESNRLYTRLLDINGTWKSNPSYEIGIVDGLRLSNNHQAAIDRLFSRYPLYTSNSSWYELNSSDPATIAELTSRFEATARKYALEYHADGQRTQNVTLYNAAKSLYGKYLDNFPLTPKAAQIRFYLAEILFKQNQFIEAANNYYLVYKNKAAGSLRLDGLRYSISALDRAVNENRKKQGLSAISTATTAILSGASKVDDKLVEFDEVETRFLNIGDEYLAQYPNQSDAADVMYEMAYLRYSHNDLASAHKIFWNLIQRFPKHRVATSSAFLVLDILNRREDFEQLISVCKTFLGHKELTKAPFTKEVSSVLRQAELKRIALIEGKGQYLAAADGYNEFTRAYGAQDELLFEKALYNASVNYTKADLPLLAVEIQERFLRRFPKSSLRQNMLLSVARTHELLTNLDRSALFYEEFSHDFPSNAQAQNALRLAGLYYWGSNHHRQAESVLLEFRKQYPDSKKLAARDLLDLYESQGLNTKEIKFYLEQRSQRGISAAEYLSLSYKIYDLQVVAQGHGSSDLKKEIARAAVLFRKELLKSATGVEAFARYAFSEVNSIDAQFSKLHLSGRNMEKSLKRKLDLLRTMETEYTAIAKLGSSEWGLGSMYRTAFAYQQMALEVSQAPVPGELSSEQVDIYRHDLNEAMIQPFTEKAKTLSKTCLEKAAEFNLLSSWVPRCFSLASELDPQNYPQSRTLYLPPLQIAFSPTPAGSKTAVGDFKRFAYPYYSMFLFQPPSVAPSVERMVAALPDLNFAESRAAAAAADARVSIPSLMDYRSLGEDRKKLLSRLLESNKPRETELPSFTYLNLVRSVNPSRAVNLIIKQIQVDPKNTALHNLLALCHLELGHLSQAKVLWLSLMARGVQSAAIYTNLGVVAWLENKESLARSLWLEATALDNSKEASLNLGAMALKYRNGREAEGHMERALAASDQDATANVGLAVALLQQGEMERARVRFNDIAKKFKSDPYARLSIGYFLIDIDKKPDAAAELMEEYLENHDNAPEIKQALSETKRSQFTSQSGGVLVPTIGQ